MSGGISATLLPFGEVGRLGSAALGLTTQYDILEAQSASGLIASNVADLGPTAEPVFDLQPQLAAVDAWNGNVAVATNRLAVAQSVMTSISSLASALSTTLAGLSTAEGSAQTDAITAAATEASASLRQLGSLLNTTAGDNYVFGGTDGTTPPVGTDASLVSGPLATTIAEAVSGLAANGASATVATILSATTNTSSGQPFSAAISGALPANGTVIVGAGESVASGIAATSGTLAVPTATSTGSPVRDLVAALSAVASLSSTSDAGSTFTGLIASLQVITSGAISGLAGMAGEMGATQDFLTGTANTYSSLSSTLSSQIGSLTSVDLPTVSTEMSETTAALQASYQLIADLKGLSLANYL